MSERNGYEIRVICHGGETILAAPAGLEPAPFGPRVRRFKSQLSLLPGDGMCGLSVTSCGSPAKGVCDGSRTPSPLSSWRLIP